MFILDTNVISELMRAEPNTGVVEWVAARPASSLFVTTVTEAELRFGVALLPSGRRKTGLQQALEAMLREDFAQRILPFDRDAASAYADILAHRQQTGRPMAQFDAQIAAIARSRDAVVVTRNRGDFTDCGIAVVDPWQEN